METTLDRAVEADQIVIALRPYGFTQAGVASATGVSERSVRNWSNDTPLRRRHEERLQALRHIVLLLDDSLTPRGVGQWFRAHNRMLAGRRPLDVLADDDFDAVRGCHRLRRRRLRLTDAPTRPEDWRRARFVGADR